MNNKPAIMASAGGSGEYELLPEGVYLARCYRMIDEGTHTDTFANAKFAPKPTHRVQIYFEILRDDEDEPVTMEDGRPFSIMKKYTLSLNSKATLRKDLEAWRGKKFTKEEEVEFNITNVVGGFCKLQVVHSDGETAYANINSIMSASKKDIKDVEPINEDQVFTVSAPDQEIFNSFSEKMQERINTSAEMAKNPMMAGEVSSNKGVGRENIDSGEDEDEDEEDDDLANAGF